MKEVKAASLKSYLSFSVVVALMLIWILAAWSGFILGIFPEASGNSSHFLLLGYSRGEWAVIHSWLSVTAVFITAVEVIMDHKALLEGIGNLSKAHGAAD